MGGAEHTPSTVQHECSLFPGSSMLPTEFPVVTYLLLGMLHVATAWHPSIRPACSDYWSVVFRLRSLCQSSPIESPVCAMAPLPSYAGYQLSNGTWVDEFGPRNGPPMNFWRYSQKRRLEEGAEKLKLECTKALFSSDLGSAARTEANAVVQELVEWFENREGKKAISISSKVEGSWDLMYIISGRKDRSDEGANQRADFLRKHKIFQHIDIVLKDGEKAMEVGVKYDFITQIARLQYLSTVPVYEDGILCNIPGTFLTTDGRVERKYAYAWPDNWNADEESTLCSTFKNFVAPTKTKCTYLDEMVSSLFRLNRIYLLQLSIRSITLSRYVHEDINLHT